MAERAEQSLFQQFVMQSAIEALGERILHRLSGLDIFRGDARLVAPGPDCVRRQLGSVVRDDRRRCAESRHDRIQLAGNALATDLRIRNERFALARAVFDNAENTEAPSIRHLVTHEE